MYQAMRRKSGLYLPELAERRKSTFVNSERTERVWETPMKALGACNPNKVYEWKRTRTILARSFYNQMKSHGYSPNQIIELSSEILGLVTTDLKPSPRQAQPRL